MKKAMLSIAVAAVVFLSSAFSLNNDPVSLELGAKAPMTDLKMEDIYGQTHSLQSLNGKAGLLVIFSCNTCPFVVGREGKSMGWEGRYNDLHKIAGELGFGSVLVNSNEAKREGDDSKEAMMRQVKEKSYMMPYVIDKNHQLADAFGARTTPHVYLFDANMNLVYKGAIDDNVDNPKEVKVHYLIDAMNAVAKGQAVVTGETKAIGCSIKRMS